MINLFILLISVLFITSCAKSDYDEDNLYSSSTSGNNSDSSNTSDNGTTFTITVSYGKYFLDGVRTKSIKLKKGILTILIYLIQQQILIPFLLVYPQVEAIITRSTHLEL